MTVWNAQILEETRAHLALMIEKERKSSEFLLASVVQDSLIYNLHDFAGCAEFLDLVREVSRVAVMTAVSTMHANEFTVCESVRGVMHSMVSLGGEPLAVAAAVTEGAVLGIQEISHEHAGSFLPPIVTGIQSAAHDLGLDPGSFHRSESAQAQ